MKVDLKKEFEKLLAKHGPQSWWPADSAFEVCVGAILTQNTSWNNVEKAIANLKHESLISEKKIAKCQLKLLEACVKPSGFYRQKARGLKTFAKYVARNYRRVENWFRTKNAGELRSELLELNGIGPETADSIILYAAEKPVFVIDAYTKRWAKRFGIEIENYDELQAWFEDRLPTDVELFKEFHALIVAEEKSKMGERKA